MAGAACRKSTSELARHDVTSAFTTAPAITTFCAEGLRAEFSKVPIAVSRSCKLRPMAQKTALITGCSPGGIGDALARELHGRGFLVFATARETAKLAELQAMGMEILQLDVTSDLSFDALASRLAAHPRIAEHGLDLLINNAGIDHVMPFADLTLKDIRISLDTNLYGSLAGTSVLLRHLVKAKGMVIMMGSITPFLGGLPFQAMYIATKTAVIAVSNSLRVEFAPLGVKVVCLVPGCIQSKLFEDHIGTDGSDGIRVPDNSWYAPLKETIEQRTFLKSVRWTPLHVFAASVVDGLLKDQPPKQLWTGSLATLVWWLRGLIWPTNMVSLVWSTRQSLQFPLHQSILVLVSGRLC
jgi:1-acylglycerone phosphate reductase